MLTVNVEVSVVYCFVVVQNPGQECSAVHPCVSDHRLSEPMSVFEDQRRYFILMSGVDLNLSGEVAVVKTFLSNARVYGESKGLLVVIDLEVFNSGFRVDVIVKTKAGFGDIALSNAGPFGSDVGALLGNSHGAGEALRGNLDVAEVRAADLSGYELGGEAAGTHGHLSLLFAEVDLVLVHVEVIVEVAGGGLKPDGHEHVGAVRGVGDLEGEVGGLGSAIFSVLEMERLDLDLALRVHREEVGSRAIRSHLFSGGAHS